MKNLILLNDDTNIKLGDTGTLMQFKADDNNAPVSLIKGQSATFRIKNEFGFLKSVEADTTMSGYVFQFDTSALDGLVPGTYQLELLVTKSDDDVDIFPDTGFVQFTINENALSITGEQLPVMSLDDFKKQAQAYVDTQINGAETLLENNFQKYVDGIQSNTVDKANKASQDATNAVSTANSANEKAQQAVNTANGMNDKITANSTLIQATNQELSAWNDSKLLGDLSNGSDNSLDFNKLPKGLYQFNGWGKAEQKIVNFPTFAINHWGQVLVWGSFGKYYQFVITDDNAIHSRVLNTDYTVGKDWKLLGGVTNRLANSDFSNNLEGFSINNSNALIDGKLNGINTLKFEVSGQTSSNYYGVLGTQKIPVTPGDKLYASVLYKAQGLDGNGKFEINIFDKSDQRLSNSGMLLTNTDDWKNTTYSATVPENAVYTKVNFFAYQNGTIWINRPMVSIGSLSEWTPSVFALQDKVNDMQQQIVTLTSKIAQLETNK